MLELYSAFRGGVTFRPEDVRRGVPLGRLRRRRSRRRSPIRAGLADADPRDIGSNNWVVAGSRTQSTYPILANDPHRAISAPSLRYWVHLVAPGWNVIGGGEPVLPGVSIGHNEHGAWGLTIFGNDNEDLYVYETNPANAERVPLSGRAGKPCESSATRLPSKGEQPRTVELKFTRHGPVIFEDRERTGGRMPCARRGSSPAAPRISPACA